ncbi:proton-conducting transporter transmembrane domain-containing protein [Algihabitans albus]|uniref:proton-conducting transporter transmembrane domain-containing protein n=1 Tax=Algihabitans albus TaxID=2164067 RepID=UPI000E5D71C0|nr:proton-conducting transporter membrane subunit [Algihabitans albus]
MAARPVIACSKMGMSRMIRVLTSFVWLLFAGSSCAALGLWFSDAEAWTAGPLRIDALALLLAIAVTFVSGIVHAFSLRYMDGDGRIGAFFARLTVLTLVVLLLITADHLVLFALAWAAMGLLLADLIGHVRTWPQAQAAARLCRLWFLGGSAALATGLAVLAIATGETSIFAVAAVAPTLSGPVLALALLPLLLAAAIQCGLFPFHGWLLSSMTAPTPVSAFMHAGLVNAGGILLARFAPAFTAQGEIMTLVFLLGAVSALAGSLFALVQSDVKRGLGASTVAQMGFMVMQCGLGFYAAAMAHLILHGLFKASLFLSAGSAVRRVAPETVKPGLDLAGLAIAVPAALVAGLLFAAVSGKALWPADSGLLLVVFAVLAAAQAALSLKGWSHLSLAKRLVALPLVLGLAALVYGVTVALAEMALSGVPGTTAPQLLGLPELLVAFVFAAAWIAFGAGLHRKSGWLYTRILSAGQPSSVTVTARREAYRA